MTEFVLIPKHLAQDFMKDMVLKKELAKPKFKFAINQEVINGGPPDLTNILDIVFDVKYREYAKSILKHLAGIIKYDSNGNILDPITGINIIDVIRFFITNSADRHIKEKIRVLLNMIKIPPSYIRNALARRYLTGPAKRAPKNSILSPTHPSVTFQGQSREPGPLAENHKELLPDHTQDKAWSPFRKRKRLF